MRDAGVAVQRLRPCAAHAAAALGNTDIIRLAWSLDGRIGIGDRGCLTLDLIVAGVDRERAVECQLGQTVAPHRQVGLGHVPQRLGVVVVEPQGSHAGFQRLAVLLLFDEHARPCAQQHHVCGTGGQHAVQDLLGHARLVASQVNDRREDGGTRIGRIQFEGLARRRERILRVAHAVLHKREVVPGRRRLRVLLRGRLQALPGVKQVVVAQQGDAFLDHVFRRRGIAPDVSDFLRSLGRFGRSGRRLGRRLCSDGRRFRGGLDGRRLIDRGRRLDRINRRLDGRRRRRLDNLGSTASRQPCRRGQDSHASEQPSRCAKAQLEAQGVHRSSLSGCSNVPAGSATRRFSSLSSGYSLGLYRLTALRSSVTHWFTTPLDSASLNADTNERRA